VSFSFGYLAEVYAGLAGMEGMLPGLAVLLIMFVIWGGIRFLGLFFLVKSDNAKINSSNSIVVGLIISMLCCFMMGMIFEINYVDGNGKVLYTGIQDLEQFIRGSYGLLTVVTIAGFLYFIHGEVSKNMRRASIAVTTIWCLLTLMSTHQRSVESRSLNIPWYAEVEHEIDVLDAKLAATHPSSIYSGQFLAATGMCDFWVAVRAKVGGYNLSNVNAWRYEIMDHCLSSDSTEQVQAYHKLLENKVDVLVASPETKGQLALFARRNNLELPADFKWVYPLRPKAK
jgi:hypothetical protein